MSDDTVNPQDPMFLLSRSLDEALPESVQCELDRALASSASLRVEAEKLRALDGLLRRHASRPAELDWEHHAALIAARIEDTEAEGDLDEIDRLLRSWSTEAPSFDAKRFTASVMNKVAAERRRRRVAGMIRSWAPLAAAAAVALAVTAGYWWNASGASMVSVTFVRSDGHVGQVGTRDSTPIGASQSSKVVVSFLRQEVASSPTAGGYADISFGTVGSAAPMLSQIVPVP